MDMPGSATLGPTSFRLKFDEKIHCRRQLGFYQFEFLVDWEGTCQQPAYGSEGKFQGGEAMCSLGDRYVSLGTLLLPDGDRVFSFYGGRDSLRGRLCVRLNLTAEQLGQLEEQRGEDGPLFALTLQAESFTKDPLRIFAGNAEVRRRFPLSVWNQALNEAGYLDSILVEVPTPGASDNVMRLFRRARELIMKGDYPESAINSRKALDALTAELGDENFLKNIFNEFAKFAAKGGVQELSHEMRVATVRRAVYILAAPAAHADKNAAEQPTSKREATALVLLLAGVLRLIPSRSV